MIKKTRHATTNFKMLKPYLETVSANNGHYHFKSCGYMDLVIEDLYFTDFAGREMFSISHYGEQNGDLMADPDMEIAVDFDAGAITPHTFRNDYMHMYQFVFRTAKGRLMYSQRLLTDLDSFLWQWLKNIESQGFSPV